MPQLLALGLPNVSEGRELLFQPQKLHFDGLLLLVANQGEGAASPWGLLVFCFADTTVSGAVLSGGSVY